MTIDRTKLQAITKYFLENFPEAAIDNKPDENLGAQTFRIHGPSGRHFVKITWEYIENTANIRNDLEKWELTTYIRSHGDKIIFLNNRGPVLLEYSRTIGHSLR